MSEPSRELVLASASPRRHRLLREAGFDFRVVPPDVPEALHPGEAPETCAQRLAADKALAVAARVDGSSCVLAADTLVVVDGEVLGKPRDADEAQRMLRLLAGRTHRVLTGVAVVVAALDRRERCVVESRVRMRPVSAEEARAYAATGEPLDKAGGYAVQGSGGRFVSSIEGSRSNVIGLPLESVLPLLEALGVERSCRS